VCSFIRKSGVFAARSLKGRTVPKSTTAGPAKPQVRRPQERCVECHTEIKAEGSALRTRSNIPSTNDRPTPPYPPSETGNASASETRRTTTSRVSLPTGSGVDCVLQVRHESRNAPAANSRSKHPALRPRRRYPTAAVQPNGDAGGWLCGRRMSRKALNERCGLHLRGAFRRAWRAAEPSGSECLTLRI